MAEIRRSDFLKLTTIGLLAASGLFSLGAILRFLGYETEASPKTEFNLGEAAKYPVGSRTVLPNIPALLIHTESGFTALSLLCTHLGCTVEQKMDGFICPCHGSQYNKNGSVLRGPAQEPLRNLRIEQTSTGQLILHTN